MMMLKRIGGVRAACFLKNVLHCDHPAEAFSSSSQFQQPKRLEGKVAIITGGGSGIGKASAHLFASEGAKVVIADVINDVAAGHTLAQSLPGDGHSYVHCDVTQDADVAALVDVTVSRYGQLDIMYNNAGILVPSGYVIADVDIAELDHVMAVNVRGSILGAKHASRVMVSAGQGGGSIIMTSSVAAVLSTVAPLSYTISKHAVLGLMKSLAAELRGHGIRVNSVSPYAIPTPLLYDWFQGLAPGLDEVGVRATINESCGFRGAKWDPIEIAKAALFLASDEARYVSGHNLVVDGGYTITK